MSLRILVVEDEPLLRKALVRFLERQGHTVVAAQGALDAIDMLAQAGYSFNVALIDYELGTTLTGLDVAKHTELGTARIMITGHDPQEMRPKFENPLSLFRAILGKPWDERYLIAVLAKIEESAEITRP